ncbi:uncharacterized protein LOC100209524 isoform X4 [Hydra vulgaris]
MSSGTFHTLGSTPNMETCVDLCCSMNVCGVAFRHKGNCYGVECNSNKSCDSIAADFQSHMDAEISHVRAGHTTVNATELDKAGKCQPSAVFKEVTLKGGINAGTYKDIGGVSTMEECQTKCCDFPACDLAFMLAGSCYLVGCYDQKQCTMQPAKESKFHPMISYVTRWNGEGVKHTILLQEKGVQNVCPKPVPKTHVTLKGGLQAGDFTDVGKVSNIEQCYDICCQQEKCNLAFMLGQNCFSVVCKENDLCDTVTAQPSIFNPQIAYVTSRERVKNTKSDISRPLKPATGVAGDCPVTKVLDHMTLKGGVDAGAYKDHGKVKDMDICRRICCEMTECHLAFMLGSNCFSVKCASVDACRAQKAKPSAYYPKISYIRKVGTNQLLRSTIPVSSHNATITASIPAVITHQLKVPPVTPLNSQVVHSVPQLGADLTHAVHIEAPLKESTQNIIPEKSNDHSSANVQQFAVVATNSVKDEKTPKVNLQSVNISSSVAPSILPVASVKKMPLVASEKLQSHPANSVSNSSDQEVEDEDLLHALHSLNTNVAQTTENATKEDSKCTPGLLKSNVTLKGGRNSGEFIEIKGLKDMKECVDRCCVDRDKKCNLAFMLGDSCYLVSCKNKDLCRTIPAPPTKFNPLVQYVRGLEEEPIPTTLATTTSTTDTPVTSADQTTIKPTVTAKSSKPKLKPKQKSCVSQPIVKDHSLRGGKKAGKFQIFKSVTDMPTCINKCCQQQKQCDVAYMEDGKCYGIQCFKKSACTAVDLRDNEVEPKFAYMDHFLEKVEEEEAEEEKSTDLDVSEESACLNTEIVKNKTLKGGLKAGKFHPVGKKDMKSCINVCCDRPDCDIAYLLNGHCYAIECSDVKLCQTTGEPATTKDSVQLAYMNKAGPGEKQRDYMVVYIIVGSLAFAATLGGLIWVVFAFTRKQRIKNSHQRLLDEEDDEPDEVLHKRTLRAPRHRQQRY